MIFLGAWFTGYRDHYNSAQAVSTTTMQPFATNRKKEKKKITLGSLPEFGQKTFNQQTAMVQETQQGQRCHEGCVPDNL